MKQNQTIQLHDNQINTNLVKECINQIIDDILSFSSAKVIQSLWRDKKNALKIKSSTQVIQALWRGYIDRKFALKIKTKKEKNKRQRERQKTNKKMGQTMRKVAVMKIQALARGYIHRSLKILTSKNMSKEDYQNFIKKKKEEKKKKKGYIKFNKIESVYGYHVCWYCGQYMILLPINNHQQNGFSWFPLLQRSDRQFFFVNYDNFIYPIPMPMNI